MLTKLEAKILTVIGHTSLYANEICKRSDIKIDSIYMYMGRLTRKELVDHVIDLAPHGMRRPRYRVTDAGIAALKRWRYIANEPQPA